jgi:hypothetical protein
MKFTDVFSVDILCDRISDPDRNQICSVPQKCWCSY